MAYWPHKATIRPQTVATETDRFGHSKRPRSDGSDDYDTYCNIWTRRARSRTEESHSLIREVFLVRVPVSCPAEEGDEIVSAIVRGRELLEKSYADARADSQATPSDPRNRCARMIIRTIAERRDGRELRCEERRGD